MSEVDILIAARAALAAALPGAVDWSDDPADPKVDRGPAFIASIGRGDDTPAAMGTVAQDVSLQMDVEIFYRYRPEDPGRAMGAGFSQTARAILIGDLGDLTEIVQHVKCTSSVIEIASGDDRVGRASLQFEIDIREQ